MKQSEAWLVQLISDFETAELIRQQNMPAQRCQAIAKYQQVAEKSAKAMVAAVRELGVEFENISRSHHPSKEIEGLRNLSRAIDRPSVEFIRDTFNDKRRNIIRELCDLAPEFPQKGQAFKKNTEYPYELNKAWAAPAMPDTFSTDEIERFRQLAWVLRFRIPKFVYAVKRRPGYSRA